MDSNIKFAFLLFDEDRSGNLEEHELVPQLRAALASPQYGPTHTPTSNQQDINYRCPIQHAVLQVMRASGRTHISLKEFQTLCWRYPRLFMPAKFIYEHLYKVARAPMEVVDALSWKSQAELLNFLNRPIPPAGQSCTSFDHYYHEDATKETRPVPSRRLTPVVKVPTPKDMGVELPPDKTKVNHLRLDVLVAGVASVHGGKEGGPAGPRRTSSQPLSLARGGVSRGSSGAINNSKRIAVEAEAGGEAGAAAEGEAAAGGEPAPPAASVGGARRTHSL